MLLSFTTAGFPSKKSAQDNAWRWDWHCGELTKDEIKRGIRNGCIFSQAITNDGTQPTKPDKRNNCIGFQSLWIDIDHNGKKTIDEQIEALAKKPSLAYTTYSHNPDKKEYRYRMIYLLDEPIYCSYERYTDIYAAFVKILMQKPDSALQEWFKSTNKVGFEGFGVDMHLQTLSQIEFTTTPEAEIREYDTILNKSDIERLSVGYTGETETTSIRNTSSASEKIYTYTTYEQDKSWWDADKERLYVRAYNSEDYLIHCNGYDVRGDGYEIMPERYRYQKIEVNGRKIGGLFIWKWKKGEKRKYIINRAAQILFHNCQSLTDEYCYHFLVRWADNVMDRASGNDVITDGMLMEAVKYARVRPWIPSTTVAKRAAVNSVIVDRDCDRWVGMSSRRPAGIIRSERRIQRAIDGICYGIENNLNLSQMVEWINGKKEENTTNKVYGRAFSEKSLMALVRKIYKKVVVNNEAYAISKDNIFLYLNFDSFFKYSLEVLRLIESNRKRRNNNWERIMEMYQQGISQSEIARTIGLSRQYVNHQILKGTCVNLNRELQNNYKTSYTKRDLNSQILVDKDVPLKNTIIESLVKGVTIKDIAMNLGINEKTVKRHIAKAKDACIIRNEGSKKFPHWVLCDNSYMSGGNITEENQNKKIKEQPTKFINVMREDFENCREISDWSTHVAETKEEKEETKNKETAISQEHQDSPATVMENNDDTYMGNEEIESMSAALKGLIDDDIYEQSRKVPEPPFDVDAMVRSLDEYFYYTGEGKDRFDEWFDYSRA